mgnify:CR=1 FL=1|tara:strand:- start:4724 stop:5785 length:1062 start_codon:yes stop_codon:yes gene_type:complete
MKKKIIFFYPEILDDGLQTTCQTYIKYFKKKFDISIIYFKKDKKYKFLSGIQLINIKNNIFSFINLIKKNKKNTVFFSLDKHYYLLILKILNFKFKSIIRIPNPISKNNKFTLSQNSGQVLSKFEIFFLKFSDVVIIYSKKNYNYFRNIYNLKNLEFIRNYFPKKNCQLNRKKIKNIFFIGRLVQSKDPYFFLKGCNLAHKLNKFNINIVGEGPEKEELVKFSKRNKLKIKFHGFIKNPFEFFKNRIDLFCLTSKFDGTPNVLGEAISYGIPCLAPKNVGMCNELLINGSGGYLYTQNQLSSFKKKLLDILRNPQIAKRKAKKSHKYLDLHGKKNTLDKLNKVINKLIGKNFN